MLPPTESLIEELLKSMSDVTAASLVAPVASESEEPKVLDTYSVVYAFILLFLVPGVLLMSRLPFGDDRSNTYSFAYVSLVTVPFLLGLVLTFLTDSRDGIKRVLVRIAILIPLIVLTGVTLMFLASIAMLPASKFLGIKDQGLSIGWWLGFAAVCAPLVISLGRRFRRPGGWRGILQLTAIAAALALIATVVIVTFVTKTDIYALYRKDVVIYIVGALSWYLPSFGLAAGFWRSTGLV